MFYLPREAAGGGPPAEERVVEGASRRHDMRRTLIGNRARAMRKVMTEPEVMLWSRLRGRGPDKPSFRRQHPFGSYILDFYCPAARLAVEVDGATHWDEAAQARDEARDGWLMIQGIQVYRIPASRIYQDLARSPTGSSCWRGRGSRRSRRGWGSPPPPSALRCARPTVPLPPLRGGGRSRAGCVRRR